MVTPTHDPKQHLAYVKAVTLAHSVALKRIMPLLLPDSELRRQVRDEICDAIEHVYNQPSVKPGELHYALQVATAEVEELFRV